MKISRPISPILTLKFVAMATSLEPSKKGGHIDNLRLNNYHTVKIGKNRSSDSWNNLCKIFILKKQKRDAHFCHS